VKVFLARQPIFNRKKQVIGYEITPLLFLLANYRLI